jgi:acetyl-CoA acetyltransferase
MASNSGELPKRQLGKTGVEVPVIGYGTAPLGKIEDVVLPPNRAVDLLNYAIDKGITYLDTSPDYGSQPRVGEVMKSRRDEVFLATKINKRRRQDVLDEIPRYAHLIAGVHVSDWREPTRGWADRVLPGDGAADLPAILRALEAAGWDGFYDLEIFSDNGAFSSAYPDSLWDLEAAELARRGRSAFAQVWSTRRVPAEAVGRRGET